MNVWVEGGSLMCHGDGAIKSKEMGVHEGSLEQGKKGAHDVCVRHLGVYGLFLVFCFGFCLVDTFELLGWVYSTVLGPI